jgi:hypothetical protein
VQTFTRSGKSRSWHVCMNPVIQPLAVTSRDGCLLYNPQVRNCHKAHDPETALYFECLHWRRCSPSCIFPSCQTCMPSCRMCSPYCLRSQPHSRRQRRLWSSAAGLSATCCPSSAQAACMRGAYKAAAACKRLQKAAIATLQLHC